MPIAGLEHCLIFTPYSASMENKTAAVKLRTGELFENFLNEKIAFFYSLYGKKKHKKN